MVKHVCGALLLIYLLLPALGWADAAFRSSNASTYASRTNNTVTAPTGIQNGDVLLLACLMGNAGVPPTMTPPAGFNAVTGTWPQNQTVGGFQVNRYTWYKVASGESGNYTVTHNSGFSQCYIAAVSGGASSQPAATQNSGTGTTTTATGITPSANGSLVVFIGSDWGNNTNALSPPTGTTPTFTERLDPGTTSGLMYVADGVLATAGATGDKSHTNNNVGATAWLASLVVIESAGGGPTDTPNILRGFAVPGLNTYGIGGPLP